MIPPLPKGPELDGETSRALELSGEVCEKRRKHLTTFLNRCADHPLLYNSSVMLVFLTETDRGAFADSIARGVVGIMTSAGGVTNGGSPASSSWFGQMFGSTRTVSSVLKDEDPQYLQVMEYTKKIEEQILGFRASAREYMSQLEQRVNATRLLELGKSARAMGECETGWGRPLARRSKCLALGTVLGAFADCTDVLTGTEANELEVVEHMRELKREFKDCLRTLSAVRETFEDRAESLLHYEVASDRYDDVVRKKGRALATVDPECLAAESLMKGAKEHYDIIVERMREELPRFHRISGTALTNGLRAFARANAELARKEASMWEMLLRDEDGALPDQSAPADANERIDAMSVETSARPLTSRERERLEKEERRADRARRRAAKAERAVYKEWKANARQALAEGRPIPPKPGSSAPVAMPPTSSALHRGQGASQQATATNVPLPPPAPPPPPLPPPAPPPPSPPPPRGVMNGSVSEPTTDAPSLVVSDDPHTMLMNSIKAGFTLRKKRDSSSDFASVSSVVSDSESSMIPSPPASPPLQPVPIPRPPQPAMPSTTIPAAADVPPPSPPKKPPLPPVPNKGLGDLPDALANQLDLTRQSSAHAVDSDSDSDWSD